MANENCNDCYPQFTELAVLTASMSAMTSEVAAMTGRRVSQFDQLGVNLSSTFGKEMSQPSIVSGLGYRTATESGSGATRVWSNPPEGGANPA